MIPRVANNAPVAPSVLQAEVKVEVATAKAVPAAWCLVRAIEAVAEPAASAAPKESSPGPLSIFSQYTPAVELPNC